MPERFTVLLKATKQGNRWFIRAHALPNQTQYRFTSFAQLEKWLKSGLSKKEFDPPKNQN
jgi:hypothetical protein